MSDKKTSWDDIPSIDNLGVDWEYEPENPLGKRQWVRIVDNELHSLFTVKKIPVKILAVDQECRGYLLDVCQNGIAVLLRENLEPGEKVKVGLFLGKEKIISKGVIRNRAENGSQYRIGLEFLDLPEKASEYIAGLISSKVFTD